MLSSVRSSIARRYSVISTGSDANGRLIARRIGRSRIARRFQSTTSGGQTGSSGSVGTHLAAGIAGGAAVLGGIYAYYHFSGAKKAVDSAKSAHQYFQQTKQSLKENAPKNPNEAIEFIRRIAKSQLAMIPGASAYVDSTLDAVDELRESHGDEVNKILNDTYSEIQAILQNSSGTADFQTAAKIFDIMRRRITEINGVANKAGKDAWTKFEKKNPQIVQILGSRYYELKDLAQRSGPEAQKILSKAPTPDAINKAQSLVQDKSGELQELAQKSSRKAWEKAVEQASPYLEKLPEIRQLISANASKFINAGASSPAATEEAAEDIFSKVEAVAAESGKQGFIKDKQNIDDLKAFIIKKAEEAQEKENAQYVRSWESLQQWVRSVPGGEEALEKLPELQSFVELSHKRGEDAKNLAKETYGEVFQVLQNKSCKAKKVTEEAKNDVEE